MRYRYKRRGGGFTLIELLIVMVIIGILAAIMIPNLLRARYRAYLSTSEHNLKSLATAMECYHTDTGTYPPSGMLVPTYPLFTAGYFKPADIRDPSNGSRYQVVTGGDTYTLICHGNSHVVLSFVAPDHPQYSPEVGLILRP